MAFSAEGVVTLAGSRLYTSMADTDEVVDDVARIDDLVVLPRSATFAGIVPVPAAQGAVGVNAEYAIRRIDDGRHAHAFFRHFQNRFAQAGLFRNAGNPFAAPHDVPHMGQQAAT